MERQRKAVARALDLLEADAAALDGEATIGTLAVLAALGYLDFRFGHEDWRDGRPKARRLGSTRHRTATACAAPHRRRSIRNKANVLL